MLHLGGNKVFKQVYRAVFISRPGDGGSMQYTLRKSITALAFAALAGLGSGALAQVGSSALKEDAPDRYVVVPGDTLWSIAERYLTAPQRWPELWNMNRDTVKNPHKIYPGDVLVLDRSTGQLTQATVETVKLSPKVRAEQTAEKEIPSIPPSAIEPYLARPLVIEPDGLDNAPTIVATQENRVILGAGNIAYVSGIGSSPEEIWHVYRRGKPLVDPDNNRTVGFEAIFLGSARIKKEGDPATVEIVAARQEIGKGDKLVSAGRPEVINYAPHAPSGQIRGRVMSIYGGVGSVGEGSRNSIVTLNRGKADGLEVGHVLALLRLGAAVGAKTSMLGRTSTSAPVSGALMLPDERYGLVFVFRVFDRVSYALVMNVSRPVSVLDVVQTP